MVFRYIPAGFIGLTLAGIIILEFKKTDVSIIRRVISNAVNIFISVAVCVYTVHHCGFTYRFWIYSMLAANLIYISNCDIRDQAVSYETIAVSVLCGLALLVWNKDNAWWVYILSAVGFAALFTLISKMTRSAIGMGDAFITGAIGLYLGFFHTLAVVFYALFLGGIVSIALFLMKKVSRHTSLPFAPFLAAGFLVSILI